MNKVFPQGHDGQAAAGTKALPAGAEGCSPLCCSRRGTCLSASVLLLLATLAALIALVTILGLPPRMPAAQACVTPTNRTGFLCHDRRSCIPASGVCDGIRTCTHGEDEDEGLCLGGGFLEVKGLEPELESGMVLDKCPGGLSGGRKSASNGVGGNTRGLPGSCGLCKERARLCL
ncbi:low-density lipoprotein receptor class A domain-containing protein 1 isoform X2 [Lemur catta]|uniref:low-density lipoprotein receptor class A domain-containing protein 1 isoform X2 n=1 Tax=Lemur catta TaxID=9447 RepID=UPI001E266FA5|nr:low-density lipoprotein receptor class A domain-containing protein 1 isoform X2 [Lemur catta]